MAGRVSCPILFGRIGYVVDRRLEDEGEVRSESRYPRHEDRRELRQVRFLEVSVVLAHPAYSGTSGPQQALGAAGRCRAAPILGML